MTKLSIIIVNWNTSALLRECIESLMYNYNNDCEIIVVDNASIDDSVVMLEANYDNIKLIKNKFNAGYSVANNSAIKISDAEYICLLNSDTTIQNNCIQQMLDFMDNRHDVVACAPALRLPNGKLQTGVAGYKLTILTAINYLAMINKVLPYKAKGFYLNQDAYVGLSRSIEVDWLAGTCIMVRKSAVNAVGGLDERYFMYAEDVEWCDRLRGAGKIYYLPWVEIVHHHGASSSNRNNISTRWLDSIFKYYRVSNSVQMTYVLKYIFAIGFTIRLIIYTILSIFDSSYTINRKIMLQYLIYSILWKSDI